VEHEMRGRDEKYIYNFREFGKFENISLFERPRNRWEHNVKMDLREMWFDICNL
jgi:hypothetical protein